MLLQKMDRYLSESKQMSIIPNQLLSIGGGEAFAPYMHGNNTYIPYVLELVYSYGYIPTIKTNGTWGTKDILRTQILSDIASRAYKYGKLVTLDISVDEFHNNQSGVKHIIRDILSNPDLCYAIRICLVGFNTPASAKALKSLQQELQNWGFIIEPTLNNDWIITTPDKSCGVYMVNGYDSPIYNIGRAKQTHTYTSTDDPNGNDGSDCLQLDNNDYAILNYDYREPIKNRPLNEVLKSLMEKEH